MKKLAILLIISCLLPIAATAQNNCVFATGYLVKQTTGPATNTVTLTPDYKYGGQWDVTYQIVTTKVADSVQGTVSVKENFSPGSTNFSTIIGSSLSIGTRTGDQALSGFIEDTVHGYNQRLYVAQTQDTGQARFVFYAFARPRINSPAKTVARTFTTLTNTNGDTADFTFGPLYGKYMVDYEIVVTKTSGTVGGTITLLSSCSTSTADSTFTTNTAVASQNLSDATATYTISVSANKGVYQKVRVISTGTQVSTVKVYALARPYKYINPPKVIPPKQYDSTAIATNTNYTFATLPLMTDKYNYGIQVQIVKTSGTVAGTVNIQEAYDAAGTTYVTTQTQNLTDASNTYTFNGVNKGQKLKVVITQTNGTVSAYGWARVVVKPIINE